MESKPGRTTVMIYKRNIPGAISKLTPRQRETEQEKAEDEQRGIPMRSPESLEANKEEKSTFDSAKEIGHKINFAGEQL